MSPETKTLFEYYNSGTLSNVSELTSSFCAKAKQIKTPNKQVLDVGINDGRQWKKDAKNWDKIIGIDFSIQALKQCAVAQETHFLNVERPSDQWPVPDNYFGLVICARTLYSLKNASELITKLIQKAAPNGLICIDLKTIENETPLCAYKKIGAYNIPAFFHPQDSVLQTIEEENSQVLQEHSTAEQMHDNSTLRTLIIRKLATPSP